MNVASVDASRVAGSSGICSEQRLLFYPDEPPLHVWQANAFEPQLREGAAAKVVSFCDMPEVESYADSCSVATECDTLSLSLPEAAAEAAASRWPPPDAVAEAAAKSEGRPEELQGQADAKRVAVAFERMASDGMLRRDRLSWALQLAGCINPNMKWVDELVEQSRANSSCLNHEEFGELVQQYDARHRRFLLEKFQQGSSTPLSSESGLSSLLRDVGLMPFPWLIKDIHQEVFGHGRGRFGRSSAEDLARICALLRDCAGFTRKEATALRAVFARCDRDRDGRLDAAGMCSALRWLGAEEDVPKALEPLVRDAKTEGAIAKDANQLPVSEPEFLTLVRACRASEQRRMYTEFNAGNWNWFGTVDIGELPRIFEEIGVVQASPDVLKEYAHACGVGHREELLFDDMCLMRECLRKAHCFLDADVSEIAAAFEEFDKDSSGSVDHAELTGALRWLGYPTSVEGICKVEEDLWLDHCRHVYSEDFQRFIAEYRDREVWYFRKALEKHHGRVPPQKLHSLFAGLGYNLSPEDIASLSAPSAGPGKRRASVGPDGLLGLWDLMRIAAQCRAEVSHRVRQTCGLCDKEVAELRRAFNRRDPHATGIISGDNLIEVIKDFQGSMSCSALERLESVVGKVGGGTWGRAAFKDLLHAVRLLRDYLERDVFRKHRRAFSDLSLSKEEVDGFRDVFQQFAVKKNDIITFEELKEMLNRIIPDNAAADDEELPRLVEHAASDGALVLLHGMDFPDFVRVMMLLLEKDFHKINSLAGKIANRRRT